FAVAAVAMCLSGCSLIDSSGIHIDYQFDPHDFVIDLGNNGMSSVPSVPCQQTQDNCSQAPAPMVKNASTTLQCDSSSTCAARLELRKALPIDLRNAMTPLPSEAVTIGINLVDLRKIDYWVVPPSGAGAQELNVSTPPIDLYVAPMAAADEHDPQATLLGTVGTLPAGSTACSDPADPQPPADPKSKGFVVCEVPLAGPGKDALGGFVK